MGISAYVARLRVAVGHDLLLLPSVSVIPVAAAGPVGAVHVYRGAGIVLRCPHCDNTLAKIVKNDSRVWIDFRGIRTLEVAV